MLKRTWPLWIVLALGCGEGPPPPSPPPPPPPPPPIVAGRTLADDAAFAIVPTSDGARLFWAAPHREGGGVRTIELSATGASRGADESIARHGAAAGGAAEQHPSQAVEIDAHAVGRHIGVAWVVDYGHHLDTQATWSTDGGRHFAPVEDLGETVRLDEGQRGRVSVTGNRSGRFTVFHRSQEVDCVARSGRCQTFRRYGLGAPTARPTTQEVSEACDPFISGAMHSHGTWYHAVCHADSGQHATTVYAIRPNPAIATPATYPGCLPLGVAPLDEGVAVMLRCEAQIEARQLDGTGGERAVLRPVERMVTCEEGRPVLRIRAGRREAKLRLGPSIARIEALLPADLAGPSARAIWTGEAILIAKPMQRSLSVHRYQCRPDGRFDRTDAL